MCNDSNNNGNNNSLPSVVCITTPETKVNYKWFKNGEKLRSNQIALKTIDEIRDETIEYPDNVCLDDLLVLHPYNHNKYIHIEDIESAGIKASKFFIYKDILQELGAISYEVTGGTKKIYERETSVDTKASFKIKPIKTSIDVNNKEKFNDTMGFWFKGTFEGIRTISNQSYQNAKDLIKKNYLQDDPFINALVNARDPKKENHQLTEHLKYEAMQEFNKSVDVAVAFNMVSIFNFSTNVKHAINEKVEYSIDIDVVFPKID